MSPVDDIWGCMRKVTSLIAWKAARTNKAVSAGMVGGIKKRHGFLRYEVLKPMNSNEWPPKDPDSKTRQFTQRYPWAPYVGLCAAIASFIMAYKSC